MANSSLQPSDQFSSGLAVCYEVKLYLATLMYRLAVGEVLEFISSDPHAEAEIREWVDLKEYHLLLVEVLDDSRTRFLIQR